MSTTLLHPHPVPLPEPSLRFLCRSWWTCWSTAKHTWRIRSDSLLATGAALSVVPPTIRRALDLQISPVPGWQGSIPSWYGVACTIGRATIWLPVEEPPGLHRECSVLVLLPKRDVPDAPPFIHLGVQFLVEHGGQLQLDGSGGGSGRLILP